jgi:cytidine deaminase
MSSTEPGIEGPTPEAKASLLAAAREAAATAYAPYSRFRVGAAVLADGRIWRGSNVENASYGLALCAERVALFNAVSAGARAVAAVAVACVDAAPGAPPAARMPCGACRQVMAEFLAPGTPVLVDGVGELTLADLLPQPFRL